MAQTVQVQIKSMKFNPASVDVKVGDTVEWTNADAMGHTAVADDGSFKSPTLKNGAKFSYEFKTAGAVPYHCSIHPGMKGKVTVT
jgi:amicyanin